MKTALIIQKSKTIYKLYEVKQSDTVGIYLAPIGFNGSRYPELEPMQVHKQIVDGLPCTNEHRDTTPCFRWDGAPTDISKALAKNGFEKIMYIATGNDGIPSEVRIDLL